MSCAPATQWAHLTADSVASAAAAIHRADAVESQPWCNFVVMRPTVLPSGTTVVEQTLRPEAPPGKHADSRGRFAHGLSNRASHRTVLADRSRQLRIKQLFYDLGPPAWDHPCFWLSGDVAGHVVGSRIAWVGRDIDGRQAASISIDGTLVELRADRGTFEVGELLSVLDSLRPAVPEARSAILETPLAALCYQARHPDLVVTVPMGYWAHRRRPSALLTTPMAGSHCPRGLPGSDISPLQSGGTAVVLNSVFLFGDPDKPQEIEYVYSRDTDRVQRIRLLVWPCGAPGALSWPPSLDRQPCSHRCIEVHGQTVYHGWLDSRYGQHEAVWQIEGVTYMMMASPMLHTDVKWFEDFLAAIL